MEKGVEMSLDDKLKSERNSLDYRAEECLDSGRNRLHMYSKDYCLLSNADSGVYCPFQAGSVDGKLKMCRYEEYVVEMVQKSFDKG